MTELVLPMIAERRESPGTDLISRMCQAEIEGERLTDEEVRAFVSLMITAGGETTDRAPGLTLLNLIEHPDQMAAVIEDRSLIRNAFVETLRYSPPVNIAGRQAAVDIELHGTTIPAGSSINCLIGAANRDPRKFLDADTFDIFRSDNNVDRGFTGAADHLGFANGRHFCVGAHLAKAEVEIALNLIFDNMHDIRLAEGFVPEPTGLWTRGVDNLRIACSSSRGPRAPGSLVERQPGPVRTGVFQRPETGLLTRERARAFSERSRGARGRSRREAHCRAP